METLNQKLQRLAKESEKDLRDNETIKVQSYCSRL